MTATRYIYTGKLAQPLRVDQRPEEKLDLLYADLAASTDDEAIIALAVRHISGFQRKGPKTRSYPSGLLRWHLKCHEQPEDKLPLLYSYLNVSTPREAVLVLAARHVPGMRPPSARRAGGPTRLTITTLGLNSNKTGAGKPSHRELANEAYDAEAEMCDFIDQIRKRDPNRKLLSIAYDMSIEVPPSGYINPAYGLTPDQIVQRYTHRKRYDKNRAERHARLMRSARD